MSNNWERVRRNLGRIGGGVLLVGGAIYAAKKAYDYFEHTQTSSESFPTQNPAHVRQRRRHAFDSHQETCDRILKDVIENVHELITKKFDCEELVNRLRGEEHILAERVNIWEELKVRAFCRILAMSHTYALTIVAFKVQKAILCKEILSHGDDSSANRSIFEKLFSSPSFAAAAADRQLIDQRIQQLFSNCIDYFTQEGVSNFCAEIGDIVRESLRSVTLQDRFTASGLQQLLSQIQDKVNPFGPFKNYTRFIVPDAKPVLAALAGRSEHFQELLASLVNALDSDTCRNLLRDFTSSQMEYIDQLLNDVFPTESNLPMAKVIPIVTDVFERAASTDKRTAFAKSLRSDSLHRYLLQLFNS